MSGHRLYRQIVDHITEIIDSGEYPVGSRLPPERELSERFGVSRPTIREAVIALEAMGRIQVKTGSGMYVSNNNSGSAPEQQVSPFELMEARVLIEGEAAALAATLITKQQLQELEDALEEMADENAEDELGPDCADRKFHSVIARSTHNSMLQSLIENLWDTQQNLEHIKQAHRAVCVSDPQIRLDEHRAIYDALARHNPENARVAMRQHFARAIDALHAKTEEEAVANVRRQLSKTRERFSANRLVEPAKNKGLLSKALKLR